MLEPQASHKNRYIYLDYMKGIGIFLVVFGHLLRGLMNANLLENTYLVQTIDNIIYSFHMPLFFFISGLLLQRSVTRDSPFSFFDKKIKIALFLYIIWSSVQILISHIMGSYTNNETDLMRMGTILWEPYAQFWFLYILIIATSVSYLLLRFCQKYFVPIFCLSVILYLYTDFMSITILKLFSANFIFVLLGCAFQKYHFERFILKKEMIILIGFITIALNIMGIISDNPYFYEQKTVISLLLAIISVFTVYAISQKIVSHTYHGGIMRMIVMIGESSLIIYLSHIIFCSGARIILYNFFNISDVDIHIIIGMVLGISLPIIMLHIFEKHNVSTLFVHGIKN